MAHDGYKGIADYLEAHGTSYALLTRPMTPLTTEATYIRPLRETISGVISPATSTWTPKVCKIIALLTHLWGPGSY